MYRVNTNEQEYVMFVQYVMTTFRNNLHIESPDKVLVYLEAH